MVTPPWRLPGAWPKSPVWPFQAPETLRLLVSMDEAAADQQLLQAAALAGLDVHALAFEADSAPCRAGCRARPVERFGWGRSPGGRRRKSRQGYGLTRLFPVLRAATPWRRGLTAVYLGADRAWPSARAARPANGVQCIVAACCQRTRTAAGKWQGAARRICRADGAELEHRASAVPHATPVERSVPSNERTGGARPPAQNARHLA